MLMYSAYNGVVLFCDQIGMQYVQHICSLQLTLNFLVSVGPYNGHADFHFLRYVPNSYLLSKSKALFHSASTTSNKRSYSFSGVMLLLDVFLLIGL